jgi:hypothetical protein
MPMHRASVDATAKPTAPRASGLSSPRVSVRVVQIATGRNSTE